MDRSTFEAELLRDGYRILVNTMQPGQVNPDHAHDFDARLLVVAGEMTVVVGDQRNTYRVGDTFSMRHGCRRGSRAELDGRPSRASGLSPDRQLGFAAGPGLAVGLADGLVIWLGDMAGLT